MSFAGEVSSMTQNDETMTEAESIFTDIIEAVSGDSVAKVRLTIKVLKSPMFIQQQIFWFRFQRFLDGVFIDENSRMAMAAKLAEDGNKEDNALRLISYIEKAESKRKIDFIVNATRCLLAQYTDLQGYFRICKAISDTLLEDLYFLRDNIFGSHFSNDRNIQGLLTSGLVYMDYVGKKPTYSFTQIAYDVDRLSVSFGNVERYPDPTKAVLISNGEVNTQFSFGVSDRNNDGNVNITI